MTTDAEIKTLMIWTFISEGSIPDDMNRLLIAGEAAIAAYKTTGDCAIFTNKRLIVRDFDGITGKKIEIYSLPYRSIDMWSSQNADAADSNAEIELWTRVGHIKINLEKGVNVMKFDKLISESMLK